MSLQYGSRNGQRPADGPRNYRVRLSRFGSHTPGDFRPSSIIVYVAGTSSIQARVNAQAGNPGYTVTDVMES